MVAAAQAAIEPAAGGSAANGVAADERARPDGEHWPEWPAGAWAMHLASVRNPSAATEEWQRLAEQLQVPAAVRQLEPQRIETAERGVFYRVLGGPFATSAEAVAACGPIRAQGDYCGVLVHGD